MEDFFGYIVSSDEPLFPGWPDDSKALKSSGYRPAWPLLAEEEMVQRKTLFTEKLGKWMQDGYLPEFQDHRSLVHNFDYVVDYQAYCTAIGLETRIYAFAESEAAFSKYSWYPHAVFLGYDCVGDNSFDSYVFWDGLTETELGAHGLRQNEYQLFFTQADAKRYRDLRQTMIQQGENMEEMGPERVVAVAMIRL